MKGKKKLAGTLLIGLLIGVAIVNVLIWVCSLMLKLFGWDDEAVSMAVGVVLVAYVVTILLDWRNRRRLTKATERLESLVATFGYTKAPGESDLAFAERAYSSLATGLDALGDIPLPGGYKKGRVTGNG